MFDAKLFHRLLGLDDPQGWLVAMDMLEEADEKEHRLRWNHHLRDAVAWRRRAGWWSALHGPLDKALRSGCEERPSFEAEVGPYNIQFDRCPKMVVVFIRWRQLGTWAIPWQRWRVGCDPRYYRWRLFRLIDALGKMEAQPPGIGHRGPPPVRRQAGT